MYVTDVESAFPMLPLAPWLWPFFLHRFYPKGGNDLHLYAHLQGDFGTRGMPGVFKVFFVDVLVQMARCASVLTLPMPIWVDDMGLIGPSLASLNDEMGDFQDWAAAFGVKFKRIKDSPAAFLNYMIGFWWDSFERTRTLDESRLGRYMEQLLEFSERKVLTLEERQQIAGRMQRAVMTMPPGAACLLANTYALGPSWSSAGHFRF